MHIKRQLTRLSPLTIGIVLLFAAAMTYLLFQAFAATGAATLYTSPSGSHSVTKGQSFTISVRVSTPSNSPVTGASVYLTYPSNLLQVTGESYSGSAYNTQLLVNNSGGVLRMDRAAFPQISGGDKLFAQVSFKAIATGSASIGFNSSSIVTSGEDDSNILGQRGGVAYKIITASTSTPKDSSNSSKPKTSSNNKPETGSDSPTSSDSTKDTNSTPSASATDDTKNNTPPPDSTIKPQDSSSTGNETSVYDFMVKVVDQQGKPVIAAEVSIGDQTVKTDKNGIAKFQGLTSGNHSIVISYKGNKTIASGEVKSASTSLDQTQPFTVKIGADQSNPLIFILPPILILVLVAIFFYLRPKLTASRTLVATTGIQPTPSAEAESTESILARLKSPETPQPGNSFKPSNPGPAETENKSGDDSTKQT